MKYLVFALIAALLLMGWLYRSANNDLAAAKGDLAVAKAVNAENARAMADMERSAETTDRVVAGWNKDRTTLAEVRNAARQAVKEATHEKDESFKAWADSFVPDSAWSLLRKDFSPGADANNGTVPSVGASGRLPGNADSGQRQ